jgi:hypothetical protein
LGIGVQSAVLQFRACNMKVKPRKRLPDMYRSKYCTLGYVNFE